MPSALFSTPRPEPGHLVPALGSAAIVLLALPVFLVAGWPLAGDESVAELHGAMLPTFAPPLPMLRS